MDEKELEELKASNASLKAENEKLTKQNADFFTEIKDVKEKLSGFQKEKDDANAKKEIEKGEFEKVLARKDEEISKLSETLNNSTSAFKKKAMDSQVMQALTKRECRDPKAFMKLMGGYTDKVKISDDFEIDEESLNSLIDQTNKSYETLGLFKKDVNPPKDGGTGDQKDAPQSFAEQAVANFETLRANS